MTAEPFTDTEVKSLLIEFRPFRIHIFALIKNSINNSPYKFVLKSTTFRCSIESTPLMKSSRSPQRLLKSPHINIFQIFWYLYISAKSESKYKLTSMRLDEFSGGR